jgi:hypothetical protein
MMKTAIALLFLAASAVAQDKPDRPREGDPARPERPRDGDAPRPRDGDRPRPPVPPPPPAPPREGGRRPVPPFNADEVRGWLRENEPETVRHLSELEEAGRREEAQRVLGEASVRMRDLADLKQRDPKGYERMQEMRRLEREGVELGERARRAPAEEKEGATKKLLENLSKQFDLREEQRVREIAELRRRVESLEKALGERKANKDRIVDKRRRELMGERVDEDW